MKTAQKFYKAFFIARKGRNFTKIINSIHVSMAVNEFLHHAFHR